MSYQVLARKWRPQKFEDVVGQQHVLAALVNGLSMQRLHHGYVFVGARGVGKTSIARLFAKGLNCLNGITATPCGDCENCQDIAQGRFVDLLEIDAASRTKVEDTRELLDNVLYAPVRGRFKIYLIDEVHMLSRHSFNALLKTLEEPPPHVKFLLATTEPQKLPITVLSRCLQLQLTLLSTEQIEEQLRHILAQEQINYHPKALSLLAKAAQGSMRDALSLTDQAIPIGGGAVKDTDVVMMLGLISVEQPLTLIEALALGDGVQLMNILSEWQQVSNEWQQLLETVLSLLHQVAMQQWLTQPVSDMDVAQTARIVQLARSITPETVQLYYEIVLYGLQTLSYAPDARMAVEMTLLRALAFRPETEIAHKPSELSETPADMLNPGFTNTQETLRAIAAPTKNTDAVVTSPSTMELLQAKAQLRAQRSQKKDSDTKKIDATLADRMAASPMPSKPSDMPIILANDADSNTVDIPQTQEALVPDNYQWRALNTLEVLQSDSLHQPGVLRALIQQTHNTQLWRVLLYEAAKQDAWTAQVIHLSLPKLVQQLALNAHGDLATTPQMRLYLRATHRHLNTEAARITLQKALSQNLEKSIELVIITEVEHSTLGVTPNEWRERLYEMQVITAQQACHADRQLQQIGTLFDASWDISNVRPLITITTNNDSLISEKSNV